MTAGWRFWSQAERDFAVPQRGRVGAGAGRLGDGADDSADSLGHLAVA